MFSHAFNRITPKFVDGTPATAVPYKRSNAETLKIIDHIKAAIGAGFNGWKELYSTPNTFDFDLSTTSRGSIAAFGHHVKYGQLGANEADPPTSWMLNPSYSYPQKMDLYG